MIKLGQRVKDKITELEGIAVTKCIYLSGCIQFCVKPKMDKDGKISEGEWIDEQNLEIIDDGILVIEKKPPGGGKREHPK